MAVLRYWLRWSKRKRSVHREPASFVELMSGADHPQVSIETAAAVVRLSRMPPVDYLVELVLGIGRQ